MPKILCVIPSRISSTRLTRKPLALIGNKPMIQHVYEHALAYPNFAQVVVATDVPEIADVILTLGGYAHITDPGLPTGSDRVAAVAKLYPEMDVIVNLQGDQPFVEADMLNTLVSPYLTQENPEMTTLASPLNFELAYNDPNVVKVITNQKGDAIYFSRAPIPYFRQACQVPIFHHLGLYAFRRDFLATYTQLTQTPLEKAELLEQLRALEHGYRIRVCLTDNKNNLASLEINTPEELALARELIATSSS